MGEKHGGNFVTPSKKKIKKKYSTLLYRIQKTSPFVKWSQIAYGVLFPWLFCGHVCKWLQCYSFATGILLCLLDLGNKEWGQEGSIVVEGLECKSAGKGRGTGGVEGGGRD